VIIMKKKLSLAVAVVLIVSTLVFAGCSFGRNGAKNRLQQRNNTSAVNIDKSTITDEDLVNLPQEDSSIQLDSPDDEQLQLTPEEIDALLDDGGDLNQIPSTFSLNNK
jgi:hypothetical protein